MCCQLSESFDLYDTFILSYATFGVNFFNCYLQYFFRLCPLGAEFKLWGNNLLDRLFQENLSTVVHNFFLFQYFASGSLRVASGILRLFVNSRYLLRPCDVMITLHLLFVHSFMQLQRLTSFIVLSGAAGFLLIRMNYILSTRYLLSQKRPASLSK